MHLNWFFWLKPIVRWVSRHVKSHIPYILYRYLLLTLMMYIVYTYLKVYANHLSGIQVMATIDLQCNSLSQKHSGVYVLQAENSMTDRGSMREVLIQVWLKSIMK